MDNISEKQSSNSPKNRFISSNQTQIIPNNKINPPQSSENQVQKQQKNQRQYSNAADLTEEMKKLNIRYEASQRKIAEYTIQYNNLLQRYQVLCRLTETINNQNQLLQQKILTYYQPKINSLKHLKNNEDSQSQILIQDEIKQLEDEIQKVKNQKESQRFRQLLHYNAIKNKQNKKYDESISILNQQLQVCFKLQQQQTPIHAEILFQLAQNHRLSQSYQSSQKFYLQALKMFQKNQSQTNQIARVLNGIGLLYCSKDMKSNEALEKFEEALRINRKIDGEHEDVANNLINIGEILKSKQQYQQAIQRYKQALSICEKIKKDQLNQLSANAYLGIAESNFNIQQYQKAIYAYYEAFMIIKILKLIQNPKKKQSLNLLKSNLLMLLTSEKNIHYLLKRCLKMLDEIFVKDMQDSQILKIKQQFRQKIEQ